jgi:hypothetical protein
MGGFKMKRDKKLFCGGYYNDDIYEGEHFEGTTTFNENIDTYTLDEVLKLGFVEGVIESCNKSKDGVWGKLSNIEQARRIEAYTESDEIAGMGFYKTEAEAEDFKQYVLAEIKNNKSNSEFDRQEQDREGYWHDVYIYKEAE